MEQMKKMWLRCETISDGKAMEKSRDYEEVEKNNGKKTYWKNCGSDVGPK